MLLDLSMSKTELWGVWQSKVKDADIDRVVIKQVIYEDV